MRQRAQTLYKKETLLPTARQRWFYISQPAVQTLYSAAWTMHSVALALYSATQAPSNPAWADRREGHMEAHSSQPLLIDMRDQAATRLHFVKYYVGLGLSFLICDMCGSN